MPFLMVGVQGDNVAEERHMDIEIIKKLPNDSQLFLEGPAYLNAILGIPKHNIIYDKKRERCLIPLAIPKDILFRQTNLGIKTKHPCKLWVRLKDTDRKYRYLLAVRQVYKNIEVVKSYMDYF